MKQNAVETGLINASAAAWVPPTTTFASPPGSPVTGSLYLFTDALHTGADVGGGSALSLCRWSGSAWTATSAPSSGALVLLEQHTASSSASLDFTACISSTYDEYEIHFVGIKPSTTNVQLGMRLSQDGGSTYKSGAGDYHWGLLYSGMSDVPTQATDTNAPEFRLTGSTSTQSTYSSNGRIRLYDPLNTTDTKFIEGSIQSHVGASSAVYQWHSASNFVLNTAAVNAFQFLFSSGNIASGTIRVYGVEK